MNSEYYNIGTYLLLFILFMVLASLPTMTGSAASPALLDSPILLSDSGGRVDFSSTPSIMAFLGDFDSSKIQGAVYLPNIWFFNNSVKNVDGILVIGRKAS